MWELPTSSIVAQTEVTGSHELVLGIQGSDIPDCMQVACMCAYKSQ